jgi:uncharacterized protein YigA (DUF484 family)
MLHISDAERARIAERQLERERLKNARLEAALTAILEVGDFEDEPDEDEMFEACQEVHRLAVDGLLEADRVTLSDDPCCTRAEGK